MPAGMGRSKLPLEEGRRGSPQAVTSVTGEG